MLLLLGTCALWTLCLLQRPRRHPILLHTIAYDDKLRIIGTAAELDALPVGEGYALQYTYKRQGYVAASSVIAWPIELHSWLSRPSVRSARLHLPNGSDLDVTTVMRKLAGVNGDFHVSHNTLTWSEMLRMQDYTEAQLGGSTLELQFRRWTLTNTLYHVGWACFISPVDTVVGRVRPYVL